ncbi:TetR/AcrR family transcriptional regulator, partial [Paraburkholderia sp. J8-2]
MQVGYRKQGTFDRAISALHNFGDKLLARQERSEQTRNAIIEAALTVLARDGTARLTFEAVARESGLSKGAVTHHFRSKADLFKGVLAYRNVSFEQFRRNYQQSRPKDAPQQALSLEIAALRQMVDENRSPARAVLSILVDDPSPMAFIRERFAGQVRQIREEAADPEIALLRWEAAWGLALYALFGLSPLSDKERAHLFDRLLDDDAWT